MQTIVVKEKEYKLNLRMQDLIAFEEKTGKNPMDIFIKAAADVEKMQAGSIESFPLSFTDICNVIKFALRQHHAKLTEAQVLQLIDDYLDEEHTLNDLMTITMDLMQRFF